MTVIDDKVVAMSFENSKFQAGVGSTLSSLDKLKAALHFPGAGRGLEQLNSAGQRVQLGHISQGVMQIQENLQALRLTAIAVFSQLLASAVQAGLGMVKALSFAPVMDGLKEYETQINAVQVILGNTAAAGVGIKEINATLDELNDYADQTIYNFGQMTRNVGTFTAAGVDLETSVASIKGIANMAALSGASAEEASRAMYQLSQAISAGKVSLMDWKSVENASMGNATFKRALAQTAVHMGTLKENAVQMIGPMKNIKINGEAFRNSIMSGPGKESWLTSDVLTTTLKQLSGDMTDAQLKAKGYTRAQVKEIQAMAQIALKAATTVKTFGQLISTTKEQLGTGWASTFEILFGDFEEAKKLFTSLSTAIGGIVSGSSDARNKVLGDWKSYGGRDLLIDSLASAFKSLGKVIAPIKDAFRQFFPAKTGADLMYFTQQFSDLMDRLKPSTKTIFQIKHTFAGLFAVLDIGWEIIKGVVGVFGELIGATGAGGGSFLSFTNNMGNALVKFHEWLIEGGRLAAFFDRLSAILAAPMDLLRALGTAIGDLFAGFSPGAFFGQVDKVGKKLSPLEGLIEGIASVWAWFLEVVAGSGKAMRPAVEAIGTAMGGIGTAIGRATTSMNFDGILEVIRTGLFGAMVVMFKRFLGRGSLIDQLTGKKGMFGSLSGIFDTLTGSMKTMQNNLKADTLQKIAIAIGILAASVVALSFVDPDKLKAALAAMTVAFGQLLIAMGILSTITATKGFLKMPVLTASLILLAGAVDLLTVAVVILSLLSWEDLAKGLGGVAALLIGLVKVVPALAANTDGMIRAGIGIAAIGAGLILMAGAIRIMGTMDLDDLGKGLAGVAAGLVIMVYALQNMPEVRIRDSIGLVVMAGALVMMAGAIKLMGSMDLHELGKGLGGVGAALVIMVASMSKLPEKSMLRNAAALVVMAGAIMLISEAVLRMSGMSLLEMGIGLGSLAGALGLLAGALYLMSGAVPGAIALGVAAAGIALLAPAVIALGQQSWGEMIKSMVALAIALGVMAGAAILITPAIPSMIGLGAALLLIGGGLALAGIGIAAVGWGLAALVVAAPAGVGILVAAFVELTKGIISNVKLMVLGLLEIVRAIAATAPKFVTALMKILDALIDGIIKAAPKIAKGFTALMKAGLKILKDNQRPIIDAGISLILALVQGLGSRVRDLVKAVSDLIVRFIQGIDNGLQDIIEAGTNLIIHFIQGLGKNAVDIANAAGQAIVDFLAGLTLAVTTYAPQIRTETKKLGLALIDGIFGGITSKAEGLYNKAREVVNKLIAIWKKIPIIGSPSRVTTEIGEFLVLGLTKGLDNAAPQVYAAATTIATDTIETFKNVLQVHSNSKVMIDIGKSVSKGFAEGIRGNADDIRSAVVQMNETLVTAMQESKAKIAEEEDKLEALLKDKAQKIRDINKDKFKVEGDRAKKLAELQESYVKPIKEAQAAIKENESILARTTAANIVLTKSLKDERLELVKLAKEYDVVTEKLEQAQEKLVEITEYRDALTDQYSETPDFSGPMTKEIKEGREAIEAEKAKLAEVLAAKVVDPKAVEDANAAIVEAQAQFDELIKDKVLNAEGTEVDPVATYMAALKTQADAVGIFAATLEKLRAAGIDDETYNKLLKEGTASQGFADKLLEGGKTAVRGVNKLDLDLKTEALKLADNAADRFRKGGVAAAEGIVKGLESRKNAIRKKMEQIARIMLKALRDELDQRSPSQEFAKIGALAMEGLALGFTNSTKMVTKAISTAAQDAMTAMKRSMRHISDAVTEELNPNPVITPILDLTQVKSQSQELAALTNTAATAALISSEQSAAQTEELALTAAAGTSIKFEQNNYSPKALTNVEIYRQTRNQMSQFRSVLAT